MTRSAEVAGLFITSDSALPMSIVEEVEAVAERGLVGDRYFEHRGKYSGKPGWGANVTLLEAEAIAAINAGHDVDFVGAMLRRNILTTGIRLDTLISRKFRCGEATLRGTKTLPPCMHLAHLLGRRDVLRFFAYCGGIGADVVVAGRIRLGDRIELLDD